MGEEKDNHDGSYKNNNKDNNDGKNKDAKDSGSKKEEKQITVVLKVEFHCLGCTSRIKKAILGFHGVDMVKEGEDNKLTVVGVKVDPEKLRDMVEKKMKKKVELISPQQQQQQQQQQQPSNKEKDKDKDTAGGNKQDSSAGDGVGDGNNNKKKAEEKKKKPDDDEDNNNNNKKPNKEPSVTTAVLKVAYHCHGCGHKIHRIVSTYKGVQSVSVDKDKDAVTVKGTMDAKALAECLKEKLRRPVEIVPTTEKKKGNEEEAAGGGSNQSGGKKKGSGGGGEESNKQQGSSGGGGKNNEVEGAKKLEYMMAGSGYVCRDAASGYVVDILHAPQWFSEENVNGCVVM